MHFHNSDMIEIVVIKTFFYLFLPVGCIIALHLALRESYIELACLSSSNLHVPWADKNIQKWQNNHVPNISYCYSSISVFRNDTGFPYNKHDTVDYIDCEDEL
jgi:hypothetical protein